MECVTVMCDYCADGLWEDGKATDLQLLAKELNLDYTKLGDLNKEIDAWQAIYEEFDFWSDKSDPEKIYNSKEFLKFLELGEKIAFQVREIIPKDIKVIYYKEGPVNARYFVNEDGTMLLKERYD
jgi:hypothetical protein